MEHSAVGARAALDAARGIFGSMTAAGDLTGASASPSGAGMVAPGATTSAPADRALAGWRAAEGILRTVTGRTDLSGQALVGEARRTDGLTLGDAHVLIALHGWMERQLDPAFAGANDPAPPSDSERTVAREALLALEHAVATVQRDSAREGTRDLSRDSVRELARDPLRDPLRGAGTSASASVPASGAWTDPSVMTSPPRRWYQSTGFLLGGAVLLLLIAGGSFFAFGSRRSDAYEEGTTAYGRGAREAAQIAFARAAQDAPDDARPLIYLGRIAREDGDLARARRFLDRAVRLAPSSALAQREMASVMLTDGNPEVARRFYVRSLELDPTDRVSQGFLACALHRLGRFDDARRWVQRAGTGEWTSCLSSPVPPPMPNGMMPAGPVPLPPR